MFMIEAVSLGNVVDDVIICMDGPQESTWILDRVKVKKDFYDEEEFIFDSNRY